MLNSPPEEVNFGKKIANPDFTPCCGTKVLTKEKFVSKFDSKLTTRSYIPHNFILLLKVGVFELPSTLQVLYVVEYLPKDNYLFIISSTSL